MAEYDIINIGLTVIGSLLTALCTAFWYFFKRIFERLDDLKKCILKVDSEHDATEKELGLTVAKLYSEVREMRGFCDATHRKTGGAS